MGRPRKGVGAGPERLLEVGAEDALASAGALVSRELIELDWDFNERSGLGEDSASFEWIGKLAERVRAARDDGAFPVILSGSCLCSVGVVAGIDEESPGVVWFDSHADMNTPNNTVSAYLDGMGLAMLTGHGWTLMVREVPGHRAIPETSALLVGARDFDEPEKEFLDSCDVGLVEPDALRDPKALMDAVGTLSPEPTGIYLHVDCDVLDSEVASANVYANPGGPNADELEALVSAVLDRGDVRAFSLTAYDPAYDEGGRVPPIAMRLLRAVAERAG